MYTLAGDQSLALFKSLSVTSDVQAIVYMDVFSQVLPRSTFFYHPSLSPSGWKIWGRAPHLNHSNVQAFLLKTTLSLL